MIQLSHSILRYIWDPEVKVSIVYGIYLTLHFKKYGPKIQIWASTTYRRYPNPWKRIRLLQEEFRERSEAKIWPMRTLTFRNPFWNEEAENYLSCLLFSSNKP